MVACYAVTVVYCMRKDTDMKWILGVTCIALVIGVVATMSVPAQTITPDEATLKLFPSETQGIGFVDVAGLRGSTLFNELILQKLPHPQELNEFVQATGFDVMRDVDRVTAGRINQRDVLAIIQARYDSFKVEQYVKDKADHIVTETYLGRVIYRGNGDSEHAGGVSFINNLIVAGSLSGVKQAIDRLAAPAPSVVQNAELMDQIRTIEAGNQVWAAGKFDMNLFGKQAPDRIEEMAGSLKSGTYQMRIDQDVHVRASGIFGSTEMAKSTGDTLRGLVAMARLQVSGGQDDKLLRLLDGVSIENSNERVLITFNTTGTLLKELQQMRGFPGLGR
jgi:hypothetical protein